MCPSVFVMSSCLSSFLPHPPTALSVLLRKIKIVVFYFLCFPFSLNPHVNNEVFLVLVLLNSPPSPCRCGVGLWPMTPCVCRADAEMKGPPIYFGVLHVTYLRNGETVCFVLQAKPDVKLWGIDRDSYRRILMVSSSFVMFGICAVIIHLPTCDLFLKRHDCIELES